MLLQLQRNAPIGEAIHGTLTIDGITFCTTLERQGVEIPALWYTVNVTMSPKFKRLLPIVNNVPRTTIHGQRDERAGQRTGIRFHVGTRPQHSTGCILVPSRDLERQLTQIILNAQNAHEQILFEVCAPTPCGALYDLPCPDDLPTAQCLPDDADACNSRRTLRHTACGQHLPSRQYLCLYA